MIPSIRRQVAACVSVVGWLATTPSVATAQPDPAQPITPATPGVADYSPAPAPKPPPVPPSIEYRLAPPATPEVALPAIDTAALLAEDAAAHLGGKCLRYGIGRDLLVTLGDGQWIDLPAGRRLWIIDIVATGAAGIRLHLADMNLPPGARLVAYPPAHPEYILGPYESRGLLDDGQFWTPTCWSDRMRLEYDVPPQKPDAPPKSAPFRIDRIQHIYRDPTAAAGFDPREGACYLDVSCFPAYANLARAIAGIGIVNINSLYCTGQLLNTQASDLTPYFLTANHCLSNNGAAQSSEIFWLFQTPACNGVAPVLASVPRSAVCTLLSTNATSDYTLLMIEGAIPRSQLFWAGWTSAPAPDGTPVAGIHHPGGAYKRISFGGKASNVTCGNASHVRTNWTTVNAALSVTEPGSSGSGLFRQDSQQLVGQLHCGASLCGQSPAGQHDDYGAFSVTYPAIAGFLAGGADDPLEENDVCGLARSIAAGAYSNLVVKSIDEDWYAISVPGGGRLTVQLSFTHAFGDIDMELYSTCGGTAVASSTSAGNSELITFTNTGATAVFRLRVFLVSDTRNTYTMNVAITSSVPANDACSAATIIGTGAYTGSTAGATNDGPSACNGRNSVSPDVWYSFTAPCNGILRVDTCGSAFDTIVSVHSACPGTAANQLACNDDCTAFGCTGTSASCLSLTAASGATYLIRIAGFNGAAGAFTLHVNLDASLPNDACANAITLVTGTFGGTTCGATSDGASTCGFTAASPDVWYSYTAPCNGHLTLDTCGAPFNTVISVHSGCPGTTANEIACNDDCTGGACPASAQSCLSLPVTAGSNYRIRVAGYGGVSNSFTLHAALTAPLGDACTSAYTIADGTYTGSTCGATVDGASSCGTSNQTPDVWFSYIAPCTGALTIDTCGSNFDTVVSVHAACPGSAANEIACNDDCINGACPLDLQSCLTIPVQASTPYLIRVSGFSGATGSVVLNARHCCFGAPDADMNADGIANGEDIAWFLGALATASTNPVDLCHADFNTNGVIDAPDTPGLTARLLAP